MDGLAGIPVSGVKPHSKPNVAASGLLTELTQGQVAIYADYPGSTTNTFDLESFYFGCVVA